MSLLTFLAGILLAVVPLAGADIQTIAGTGEAGYAGDGRAGTKAQIANPYGLAIGPDDALYFCEIDNHVIRRLDLQSGELTTVAGNGEMGYSGDGGPATEAQLNEPYEIRFDKDGNMFFVEMRNHLVRRVDAQSGVISTVAGTGAQGFAGDGGEASKAQFSRPHSIEFGPDGSLYVCDIGNHRIRRVDLITGRIETFAGTGEKAPTPDGARLAGTPLNGPRAIAFDASGAMVLALREGNAVYRIDLSAQTIHHVAGTGEKGWAGDGGPAAEAKLAGPKGVAVAPDGSILLADTESHTIRRIKPDGTIETIAGDGTRHDGPDGNPHECGLARPHGVFAGPDGAVYIGDSENNRIRVWRN